MRELTERDKALLVDGIPGSNLRLFYAGLQGRGSTLIDRSQNGYHATISAATWVRLPRGLRLLRYNGSTSLVTLAIAGFAVADSFGAIELWFKTSSASLQCLVGSSDTALTTYNIYLYISDGDIGIKQIAADTADEVKTADAVGWADGKYHHIVMLSTGTAWQLYVDGVQKTLATVVSGSNNGDWFADTPNRDNITLGVLTRTTSVIRLNGDIALPRVYGPSYVTAALVGHYTRERHLFGV